MSIPDYLESRTFTLLPSATYICVIQRCMSGNAVRTPFETPLDESLVQPWPANINTYCSIADVKVPARLNCNLAYQS